MLKIGLTGGIGSGKSLVAKVFLQLQVPVFFADEVSRNLSDHDDKVKEQLRQLLGDEVFDAQGKLRRGDVARRVFTDRTLLDKINAILHPAVAVAFDKWLAQTTEAPYIMKEAAILFESSAHQGMDGVICVTAPDEMRIARVMKRDGIDRQAVEMRMQNQWPQSKKMQMSDYIIVNDERQMILPQILRIHEDLIRRANPGS